MATAERVVLYDRPNDRGTCTALVARISKRELQVLTMQTPLRIRRVPIEQERHMVDLDHPPLEAVKRKYRLIGKHFGMSKAVRRFLRSQ